MPRAGLGYESLREHNPRLIYAQLSGFGYDGPYASRGGFDLIAQGMGGIMHVTGEPDGPPTSVGLPICDLGTGMWAVQGILAALYERTRTDQGQLVECSLLETAIGYSSWTSAGWLADRVEPTRQGSRHRQNAPYQRMLTQDGYIMIGAGGQSIWERCAKALGQARWCDDERFASAQKRMANREALEEEMERVLSTAPTAHWVEVLEKPACRAGRSTTTSSSSATARSNIAKWSCMRLTKNSATYRTFARRSRCRAAFPCASPPLRSGSTTQRCSVHLAIARKSSMRCAKTA